jgi:hypothetical protein
MNSLLFLFTVEISDHTYIRFSSAVSDQIVSFPAPVSQNFMNLGPGIISGHFCSVSFEFHRRTPTSAPRLKLPMKSFNYRRYFLYAIYGKVSYTGDVNLRATWYLIFGHCKDANSLRWGHLGVEVLITV